MISRKKEYIFIHNIKTAGRSIIKLLSENNLNSILIKKQKLNGDNLTDIEIGHHSIKDVKKEFPNYYDYTSFCVIRNPYDRLLSYYTNSKRKPKQHFTVKPTPEISFIDFLKINNIPSQLSNITNEENEVDIHYIIRFENLENDLKETLNDIGIEYREIPKLNYSTHSHYSKYYNDECKKWIEEKYKDDLDYFEYSFENI